MSYWSLRRAAERSTAAAEFAHGQNRQVEPTFAPEAERPAIRLPDWTPEAAPPHRVAGPACNTVRQRVTALEDRVFTVPDELAPEGESWTASDAPIGRRSRW